MTKTQDNPTKALFDCLSKLYKQGQLLLMDADRLMGEQGWEPMHTTAPAGFSNSLNSPERWYARWATRFYRPAVSGKEEGEINQILFVSTHFTSDHDTTVNEPVVSAGRLLYEQPMNLKTADRNYDYYMCKYWFWGQPHDKLEGWRKTGQSKFSKNLKGSETFSVPLYNITSSEELKRQVIDPLLSVAEQT
jgi:hypothetical protein